MKKLLPLLIISIIGANVSYGEEIFTTLRSDADKTIFDGKWTFLQEWKSTSEDVIVFSDGNKLSIKTGHDYNNLYVLLDFISDHSFAKSADLGIVCIDSDSGKEIIPQNDDYCFIISLGSTNPVTLQGGSPLGINNHFSKIDNHPGLIAVGGISDTNDRYTPIPHTTYEFKIPLETFGKSDTYGFYVSVYDAKTGKVYSWPQDTNTDKYPFVPSPAKWGSIISPDKSIPEFELPMLILALVFLITIYFTKFKKQTELSENIRYSSIN